MCSCAPPRAGGTLHALCSRRLREHANAALAERAVIPLATRTRARRSCDAGAASLPAGGRAVDSGGSRRQPRAQEAEHRSLFVWGRGALRSAVLVAPVLPLTGKNVEPTLLQDCPKHFRHCGPKTLGWPPRIERRLGMLRPRRTRVCSGRPLYYY